MKKNDITKFIAKWSGRGNEKQDTQQFWNDVLYDVLGAPKDTVIQYEKPVKINGKTKFIDGYLPDTRVLIEQKSLGIDLMKAELQSDGMKLTPFEQGRRYGGYLPFDEQPRWIIDCNFEEIRVHDMKKPGEAPEIILLKDMEKDYTRLNFLIDSEDEHIKKEFEVSVKAGEIVGVLYDKLLEQYNDPGEHDLQSLNRLCVRIVFCMYAEDAGLFGSNTHAFHDYMVQFNGPARFRNGLKELFSVLNQPLDQRDPYLDPELAAFPYVNGGLFADDALAMPFFTDEILDIILERASEDFDWSDISPTIFGAIFESTLNPETRRSGGMHYTSIENIHKVIDPLFLDELKDELTTIIAEPVERTKVKKLKAYQDKLAGLKFLDPACGSGNFLTESYLCLRKLENDVIAELSGGQVVMGFEDVTSPIKVSIEQFYGIEINDFACATAQTAMWIAEAKMMKETEALVRQDFDFFPLTTNANIVEGNALRMDWNDVVPASQLNYIMGNPPFLGYSMQNPFQKEEMLSIWTDEKGKSYKAAGKIDYVSGWYKKAAEYIQGTSIRCAFVSTNSITQGEQVAPIWETLCSRYGIHIDFAWRTFVWDSEASSKAAVHCVIIGFSSGQTAKPKVIYNGQTHSLANNINAYLVDAPNVFVASAKKPLCDVPEMITGNRPADGGHLIIEQEDYDDFIQKEPGATKFIKTLTGSVEFINNRERYCLWLVDATPGEIMAMPEVMKRVDACREDRLKGAADRQKLAETPTLFRETHNPDSYILVPATSSENRRYIPMGFLDSSTVSTNSALIIPNADLYTFGILESNVHMSWVRTVCGRLKSDYRYSKDIVYNNFPWPSPTEEQRARIEATAQGIIDARALYPNESLAKLYGEKMYLFPELVKAHQANDRAVMEAYGFDLKMTEQECVAELMKMYKKLTEGDE